MDVLSIIEKIPATFWGVLSGSFITLAGVALTNYANDRRHRSQLEHDRKSRDRERELSLKKDVYLTAAEAIADGFASVGRFANLELSNDDVTSSFYQKAPSIAKMHIIAQEETIKTIVAFTSELSAIHMRLILNRSPILAQKLQISLKEKALINIGAERDHMLDLMKQHNLDGSIDARRFAVIQGNFDFEQKAVADTIVQHNQLLAALKKAHLKYAEECIEESYKLQPLIMPIVASVRKELDLPLDGEAYKIILENAQMKLKVSVKNHLNNIDKNSGD